MKKKFFLWEYLLEGLILAAAATDYFPSLLFIPLFATFLALIHWRDGLQPSTLYYIPIAAMLLIGRAAQIPNISAYICVIVVVMQYVESPVYELPENKKLVGLRKYIQDDGADYYEFFPIQENDQTVKRIIRWNQGHAFQKIIQSKEVKGISLTYTRFSLSYIEKMTLNVAQGEEKQTKTGMAFCHGRDAAPFWYSTLLMHFASNNTKVGARQHPNLALLPNEDKAAAKKFREQELSLTADQYYQTISILNCEELMLVGHSCGCAALLQAYHTHNLASKVTRIILLDPYLFPLPDQLLNKPISCPVLVLANQYLLNFQDMFERHSKLVSKKNVQCVVWKEGSDLYQTDLCLFFSGKAENWENKFQMNLEAINTFVQGKQVEGTLGDNDLGRKYRPQSFLPQKLFIF